MNGPGLSPAAAPRPDTLLLSGHCQVGHSEDGVVTHPIGNNRRFERRPNLPHRPRFRWIDDYIVPIDESGRVISVENCHAISRLTGFVLAWRYDRHIQFLIDSERVFEECVAARNEQNRNLLALRQSGISGVVGGQHIINIQHRFEPAAFKSEIAEDFRPVFAGCKGVRADIKETIVEIKFYVK